MNEQAELKLRKWLDSERAGTHLEYTSRWALDELVDALALIQSAHHRALTLAESGVDVMLECTCIEQLLGRLIAKVQAANLAAGVMANCERLAVYNGEPIPQDNLACYVKLDEDMRAVRIESVK
jgi:hypothetical protein